MPHCACGATAKSAECHDAAGSNDKISVGT
jgi:hypothetical protein